MRKDELEDWESDEEDVLKDRPVEIVPLRRRFDAKLDVCYVLLVLANAYLSFAANGLLSLPAALGMQGLPPAVVQPFYYIAPVMIAGLYLVTLFTPFWKTDPQKARQNRALVLGQILLLTVVLLLMVLGVLQDKSSGFDLNRRWPVESAAVGQE